jgi:hypothetical protein
MRIFSSTLSIFLLFTISLFSQVRVQTDFPSFAYINQKVDFLLLFENIETITDEDIEIDFLFSSISEITVNNAKIQGEETSDPNFKLYRYTVTKDFLLQTPALIFGIGTDKVGRRDYEFLIRSQQNPEIFHKKGNLNIIGIPKVELSLEKNPVRIKKNEVSIHKIIVLSTGSVLSTNVTVEVIGNEGIEPLKTILNKSTIKANTLVTEAIPILNEAESKSFMVSFQALKKGTWKVLIKIQSDQMKKKEVGELVFIVD